MRQRYDQAEGVSGQFSAIEDKEVKNLKNYSMSYT